MHFASHTKMFIIFFSSFSASIYSTKADVGKLLWTQTSYIIFEAVYLYLGVLENVVAC